MTELAQNIRTYRKRRQMTQEDVAEALHVAPQTVSKWERGETYPDVLMLPALAHLFETSTDALLGMDGMEQRRRQGEVYTRARGFLRRGEWTTAVETYEQALRLWPSDAGLLCDLAMALGMRACGDDLPQAMALCTRVLESDAPIKVRHTAMAAACYLLQQMGQSAQAAQMATRLPHQRESREVVCERLAQQPSARQLQALLYELSTGEEPTNEC